MKGINWHPEYFRTPFERKLGVRSFQAGAIVQSRSRLLAGRPGTPRLRSKPGESPRRQTGRLVLSIATIAGRVGKLIYSAVGSPLDYAGFLSRGNGRMAARPFLDRALNQLKPILWAFLTRRF